MEIATWLAGNPQVSKVHYPGMESHPDHALAKVQMTRPGAMVSFEVKGPSGSAEKILRSLGSLTLAESLGSVETLLCHPWSMTHASIPETARRRIGLTDNLVRVSVGVEHPQDLIEDLGELLGSSVEVAHASNGRNGLVLRRPLASVEPARKKRR